MTTTTDLQAAAANPCTLSARPRREAWVSLIAGYCLCVGGIEIVWLPMEFLFSRHNVATSFQFYFTNRDWKTPWALINPLTFVWSALTPILYVTYGSLLWFQRGRLKRSALIVLSAMLIESVFRLLGGIQSYFAHPGGYATSSFIFNSLALLWQIAIPSLVMWLVLRDMPDCDRWRPILASWFFLMGFGALSYVAAAYFGKGLTSISLQHPGWRVVSWDTLWPVNSGLRLVNGAIGIIGGLCLWRGSSSVRWWAWTYATSNMLLRTVNAFALLIIFNNGVFSGLPGSRSVQFSGFQTVKWEDWFGFITVVVKGAAIVVPLIIFAHHQARRLELDNSSCQHCGYNLTGNTSGRCPECGNPTNANTESSKQTPEAS